MVSILLRAGGAGLLLSFSFALTAADLRISLKDGQGAAVAAAQGWLENNATRRRLEFLNASTMAVGGVPEGTYRLRITRAGFLPHVSTVTLREGSPAEVALTLVSGPAAYSVDVVSATPLAGLDRTLEEIPAPVQTASGAELADSGALDVSSFLNRRMNNVFVNEMQGNPMQPDVNYRGYTASPLLGTPQGVSIYLDGVRMNQPFGEAVSWDLIPRVAVAEMALMAGSNPLFGLNTLGGALSLRSKDGLSAPGTQVQLGGGSFGRKTADIEHGGAGPKGLHWFAASSLFFEDGWRETSPSNVRQFFGKLGSQREKTSLGLTVAYANNSLLGNGLQEQRLLERDYRSVYTKPDATANRSPFLNGQFRRTLTPRAWFSGNAYFRHIRTRTLNGDINEESLDQSLYQPNAAERAALAAAGFTGVPAAGENAANTPFPRWRCLGNVLLRDEPAEKCNGLLNRSGIGQKNYGVAGQVGFAGRHQFTVGGAWDGNRVDFQQSSELGYLNPDRSVTGTGAFGDGVTGGEEDGEPYDTRVDLRSRIHSASVFATDTFTVANVLTVTLSARFNHTTLDNRDQIRPVAGTGSLTGRHTFARVNPGAGATYRLGNTGLSLYGNVSEASRAPSSIELGCADPNSPCKLPNSMAGDPPLEQVISRSYEAGVRGGTSESAFRWSAGYFQATNRDDILFVASEQTGYGYFRNFERTRRRGMELEGTYRLGRLTAGAGYTLLDATFQSAEEVNGVGNSTNEEAQDGLPGVESTIEIEAGNRIPLTPRHMTKVYADVRATSKLTLQLGVIGVGGSFARGNENNAHRADGRYYLGEGWTPGYTVANAGARYDLHRRVQLFVNANNLFDRKYYSASQLGPTGFTAAGNFVARPFAAIGGEFPVQQSGFLAPGAPLGVWGGVRLRF